MANSQPFRTSPQLGPQLSDVFTGLPYWDLALGLGTPGGVTASYKLGDREVGNDGAEYIWVVAGGSIASNANGIQLAITFPGFVATTGGTSGWWTPVNTAISSGQYFHARLGSPTALPAS